MKIIGITGPAGSGKTTLCNIIKRQFKSAVFNADKVVHSMYDNDQNVISQINQIAPGCIVANKVDRKILLIKILKNHSILYKVEDVVHKAVQQKLLFFLKSCNRNQIHLAVLDVPLIFKIKAYLLCDNIFYLYSNKIQLLQRIKTRYKTDKFLPQAFKHHILKYQKSLCRAIVLLLNTGLSRYDAYKIAGQLIKRISK